MCVSVLAHLSIFIWIQLLTLNIVEYFLFSYMDVMRAHYRIAEIIFDDAVHYQPYEVNLYH